MAWMERRADRNNNTTERLNLKILDIGSRAYQILLFKFMTVFEVNAGLLFVAHSHVSSLGL